MADYSQSGSLPQGSWKQPAIGGGLAFLGSIPGLFEARRLRKERERLLKEGAPGFTEIEKQQLGLSPMEQEQLAAARQRAASILAPGYAQEMENIGQQQAETLGAAKRAGIGGSNLLNTLSRLNLQGQAARRNLVMRGEQAQRAAKEDLQNLAMTAEGRRQQREMAADINRQRRVQNWEAKLAAMDAARRQYNAQAAQAPFQGALAFMPPGGINFGATKPDIDVPEQMETKTPTFVNPNQTQMGLKTPQFIPGYGYGSQTYTPAVTKEMYQRKYGQPAGVRLTPLKGF